MSSPSQVEEARPQNFCPDWESLLRPRRIALVGASDSTKAVTFTDKFMKSNAQFGYQGHIFFVNPRRTTVFGQPCYPSLSALPEVPECVVISIPALNVLNTVEEGLRLGARAFVVNTGGFAESNAEGQAWQAKIRHLCMEANAGLIGPNCLGFINVKDGVSLYGAPIPPDLKKGPVGAICQSGSATIVFMNNARDIGFSYIASTGNEAVLTTEDLLELYIDDPAVRVIMLFLEGLRQPRRFVQLAQRALVAGKPIVVLKVGLTSHGGRIARGHTASLAGSGRVHEAVFRQLGVVQVFDFDQLVETTTLFSRVKTLPQGSRTAILGISGGELALVADMAESVGLPLPPYAPETATVLRETLMLPDLIPAMNPLDIGAGFRVTNYGEKYYRSLVAVGKDPNVDIVAVSQDAQSVLSQDNVPFYQEISQATARGAADLDKPIVFFSHLSAGFHPDIIATVLDAGLPLLQGTGESLKAIRDLGWYAARHREVQLQAYTPDASVVRRALAGATAKQGFLGERETKRLLAAYGIPVTRDRLATSVSEAVAFAREIDGPVVLKIESPDIVHKSEVGGVRLGLVGPEQVQAAYAEMVASVQQCQPSARITGVVVAEQVLPGVELIVGVNRDSHFGPVLLVGLGGVLVEVLNQVALALPPLTRAGARRLLEEMPGHQVLGAFRGRPAADVDAVADVLVRVGQLALDGEGLFAELDINPLVVGATGQGCRAVDARIILIEEG